MFSGPGRKGSDYPVYVLVVITGAPEGNQTMQVYLRPPLMSCQPISLWPKKSHGQASNPETEMYIPPSVGGGKVINIG